MNSSTDINIQPKVRAWSPVELDLSNPKLEAAASFFELEPMPVRDHTLPAHRPAHPSAADLNPSEAGSPVKAWMPRELDFSLLDPLGDGDIGLDWIEEKAFNRIKEKALRKARMEAEQLLSAVQNKAEEILRSSQENAAGITQQAREQGIASARGEISGLLDLANQIVAEVQNWQEGVLRQSESLVLTLVQDITGKLFGYGFTLDPESLEKAFERGLVEAKSLGDLRIRAHPEDVAALDELWPARQTAIRGQKIEMVPDQDIQRGGCYIDGQFGSVDGRLETQLMLVNHTLSAVLETRSGSSQPLPAGVKYSGADQA